jgi:hypothetical protein
MLMAARFGLFAPIPNAINPATWKFVSCNQIAPMNPFSAIILLCIISLPHYTFADFDPFFCLKVKLELKNGNIREGFVTFASYTAAIDHDDSGYFYTDFNLNQKIRIRATGAKGTITIDRGELTFHKKVFEAMYDTIRLFSLMKLISISSDSDNHELVAVPFGNATKVPLHQVAGMTIISETNISYFTVSGSFTLKDAAWVSEDTILRNLIPVGGSELCTIYAIPFKALQSSTMVMIERLRTLNNENAENLSWEKIQLREKEIANLIDQLRKQKIIVISFCSC